MQNIFKPKCEVCNGTGVIADLVHDPDSHQLIPTDECACPFCLERNTDDPTDDYRENEEARNN